MAITDQEPVLAPAGGTERTRHPLVRSQRILQVVLGLFWILDAALQFQPFMFSKDFVPTFVLANASGQPTVIHWVITNVGNFLAPHPAVWNSLFALTQLAIGVGLLFPRTVRPALALSFPYALGVWVFGEGFGMLLGGSATALTGAPGSVLIYALIGLMAWPHRVTPRSATDDEPAGIASSAAAQGIGGVITPLAVWTGFWVLSAVLFILPLNRTKTSISSAITGMAPGNPSWYAHFLTSTGNHFASVGTQTAWVLAILSLVVGIGPLVGRRPSIFLAGGGFLAALLWITGQGFLGGTLTGTGTDPNTGPLIVLLALAMVPTREATAGSRTPAESFLRWNPVVVLSAGVVVILALVLSAAYPSPAQETSDTAMAGMTGMTGNFRLERPHGRHRFVFRRQQRRGPFGAGREQHAVHDHERDPGHEHERG